MKAELSHILFVLDHLHTKKSGVYALVRWTIHMLRSCPETKAARITCTTCKTRKQADCDVDYVDFTSKHDIQTLYPSHKAYPLRKNENELTVEDLNQHDKQYFRRLETGDERSLNDVTHIVVAAPLTVDCCMKDGLIDRIKEQSQNSVKVVLLNYMSNIETVLPFLCDRDRPRLNTIVCIEDKMFEKCSAHVPHVAPFLDGTKSKSSSSKDTTRSILLYPTFEELKQYSCSDISHSSKRKDFKNYYLIVTLYSSKLECQETNFLEEAARQLGKAVRLFPGGTFEWFIQLSYEALGANEKESKINDLKQLAACDRLKIKIYDQGILKNLNACSLCIQPGNLDTYGFSGLEVLLSGVPTLVLKDSDVWEIVKKVKGYAHYFTLTESNLFDSLCSRRFAFHQAKTFQNVYCKYVSETENKSTVRSVQDYLEALTGQRVKEKDLKDKYIQLLKTDKPEAWGQEIISQEQIISAPKQNTLRNQTAKSEREPRSEDETVIKDLNVPSKFEEPPLVDQLQTDDVKVPKHQPLTQDIHSHFEVKQNLHNAGTFREKTHSSRKNAELNAGGLNTDLQEPTNKDQAVENTQDQPGACGNGARPKIKPKISLAEFLETYEPEKRTEPRRKRDYKLIVIPPENPLRDNPDDL